MQPEVVGDPTNYPGFGVALTSVAGVLRVEALSKVITGLVRIMVI
jgi:hypothetical protein